MDGLGADPSRNVNINLENFLWKLQNCIDFAYFSTLQTLISSKNHALWTMKTTKPYITMKTIRKLMMKPLFRKINMWLYLCQFFPSFFQLSLLPFCEGIAVVLVLRVHSWIGGLGWGRCWITLMLILVWLHSLGHTPRSASAIP